MTNQAQAESRVDKLHAGIMSATNRHNAMIAKRARNRRKKLIEMIPGDSFIFVEAVTRWGITNGEAGNLLAKMIKHKELTAVKERKPWIYIKVPGAFDDISSKPVT